MNKLDMTCECCIYYIRELEALSHLCIHPIPGGNLQTKGTGCEMKTYRKLYRDGLMKLPDVTEEKL